MYPKRGRRERQQTWKTYGSIREPLSKEQTSNSQIFVLTIVRIRRSRFGLWASRWRFAWNMIRLRKWQRMNMRMNHPEDSKLFLRFTEYFLNVACIFVGQNEVYAVALEVMTLVRQAKGRQVLHVEILNVLFWVAMFLHPSFLMMETLRRKFV